MELFVFTHENLLKCLIIKLPLNPLYPLKNLVALFLRRIKETPRLSHNLAELSLPDPKMKRRSIGMLLCRYLN